MKHLFAIITIIGSLIGALFLFISFAATDSAPQQAALAATAVGFATIPYCLTRAIQILTDKNEELLRSVVSEIRRASSTSQRDGLLGSQRTVADSATADTLEQLRVLEGRPEQSGQTTRPKPETIAHPEKGATRR